MTENPYAPPQVSPELVVPDVHHLPIHLASRWARLGAVIIDGILLGAAGMGIGFFLTFVGASLNLGGGFDRFFWADTENENLTINLISTGLDLGIYLAINVYFLLKSGQTIGKKALGIQVVSYNTHQLLVPGKIIGIRYVLPEILYIVPAVGPLFGLIDLLAIFGREKRCLHDLMAGSIVIRKRVDGMI